MRGGQRWHGRTRRPGGCCRRTVMREYCRSVRWRELIGFSGDDGREHSFGKKISQDDPVLYEQTFSGDLHGSRCFVIIIVKYVSETK